MLKTSFMRRINDLDGPEAAALKLPAWKEHKQCLLQTYQTLEIAEAESSLVLTMSGEIAGAVLELVQNFLQENAVRTDVVCVPSRGAQVVILRHLGKDVNLICSELANCAVKIHPTSEDQVTDRQFTVSGTIHGLKSAVDRLRKLAGKVVEKETDVVRPGMPHFLRSEQGKKTITQWCLSYNAFVEEVLENESAGPQELTPVLQDQVQVVAEVRVGTRLLLKIVVGDITDYNVDVIVNAANEKLEHVGGLAHNIIKKGRPISLNTSG